MNYDRSFIISIIAIFISLLSLAHGILVVEYGVIVGHTDYRVSMKDRLNIYNDYQGLEIRTNITINNDGTVPLRIDKIEGFLKFNSERHIFQTTETINIPPKNVWNGTIALGEKVPDEDNRIRSNFGIEVINDLLVKSRNAKDNNAKIFLSDALYQRAVALLKANTDWIHPDANYFFMLLLWINGADEDNPSQRKLYQFEITPDQIKVLRDYQWDSYRTPRHDIIDANKFVFYSASTKVNEVKAKSSMDTVFNSYRDIAIPH